MARATIDDEAGTAILAAAGRLLTEEGPDALTVRRIASEAGGSTMNVYSRFGGKDGVVEALFAEGFRKLARGMADRPQTDDALADLLQCGVCYRQFALDNPAYYEVMFGGRIRDFTPSDEAKAEAHETLAQLAARVRAAMDAGHLRAGDPLAVAADLWATNHGLVSLELGGMTDEIDWPARHAETLAAVIRGLAP